MYLSNIKANQPVETLPLRDIESIYQGAEWEWQKRAWKW